METQAATRKHRAEADALFTNGVVLRLNLEISPAGLASLRREPREYVVATLREGTNVHPNVAVHLKGSSGSFRQLDDRPGFTLNFDNFQPDGRFHGLRKLHLNNGRQDPTRLSELIAGELFRQAGVPAARAAHALVELNGRPMGLYVLMEAMNKEYLEAQFQNPDGNLYGQSRGGDVNSGLERMEGDRPLDHADLEALTSAALETNVTARVQKLEQLLDVNEFLSLMAVETLLAHWDGYTFARHNYRVYCEPAPGKAAFMPHDLDQLMLRPLGGLMPIPRGLVAQAVMNTPDLRARYQERVTSLATNLFVVPRLTNHVDRAVAAILPAIETTDPGIAAELRLQAENFKTRIINRGAAIARQLQEPDLGAASVDTRRIPKR